MTKMQKKKQSQITLPKRVRGSAYDDVLNKMLNLRIGEALEIDPPKGVTATTYNNRLNQAMIRREVRFIGKWKLVKRVTAEGKLSIWLERK